MLIDVSRHQGSINWEKVKASGVEGAIIRCGFGGNSKAQDDKFFERNVKGCVKNGIPFGVYLYSYAKSVEAAKREAEHVLRLVKPYKDLLSYPVYYDIEEAGTENGAIDRAIAFGDIIEAEGFWCGIYANEYWWKHHLKGLDRFTKWVAKYSKTKPSVEGMDIWQYTSSGNVDGIIGNVDCNHVYRNLIEEIKGNTSGAISGTNTGNLEENTEAADVFAPGDTVVVVKAVTYDGKRFKRYHDAYEVIEAKGDRVVIGINGEVTAAVNGENLKRV